MGATPLWRYHTISMFDWSTSANLIPVTKPANEQFCVTRTPSELLYHIYKTRHIYHSHTGPATASYKQPGI
eukprot:scaffold54966_cov36-Prasinocladus_malaysianus.AAC.1